MPHNRYFLDHPLLEGESVPLEGNEFHHLTRVMRQRVGDPVEIVNGKNQLAQASLLQILKEKALLEIRSVETQLPDKNSLFLAQALPKLSNLEFILEKGTELGATAFWLFPGMLSEKEAIKPEQLHKLRQWVISAMKQCGRLDLPEIKILPTLKHWEKPPGQFKGQLYFGDTRPDAPNMSRASHNQTLFFIGPEKGFHPNEIEILEKKWNAKGVRLSRHILRVETAAIAALALSSAHAIT